MIYIFGEGRNISVVYDPSTLTEQDKQGGKIFPELPPQNAPEGYYGVLVLENNQLHWEYKVIPEDIDEEELI